ncbi:General amino-acid permease GAP1 [Candida viswanathii]|uniref:General amino-acid permease GAP1 n=1 Tax=Candida viswanathii TaxID=5486 RepID=A0A367YGP5_9ASCO|nr:General amino-acid permease GAP1 [Candida viswanathii]
MFSPRKSKKESEDTYLQVTTSTSDNHDSTTPSPSSSPHSPSSHTGIWHSMIDSFKPAVPREPLSDYAADGRELTDIEKININTANTQLKKGLADRHLQMIALGSSIGTGLFVGLGLALATGGPASCVIAWGISAISVYLTMQGLGEMASSFPMSGGFLTYCSKFIHPSVGFAIGWNYFMQFFVLLPLELVAGAITIKYWNAEINSDVFVTIFWVTVVVITLLGVRWYGEAELIFCLVKIVAIVGFIILGIVLIAGGGPSHEFIGGRYWNDPGPFNNGVQGTMSNLVTAAFSFGGTEMIALTASEAASIRLLPKAIKQVFWRIVIFYFGSIIMIATLVPYSDERLLGSTSVDVTASPFTIAIVNGGIKGLPSVINAVILISVLSVGNASVYATSRTLNSLAEQGMAPKWTGYIDRAGRPLFAILITNLFGLFAMIATDNDKQVAAFDWLLALSGLSSVFTWLSINVAHLRFRRAMQVQNRSLDELPFVAQTGVWGSYVGAGVNLFFLGAQFYVSLFPVDSSPNAYDFFLGYLGFPVIVLSWVGYNIWKHDWSCYIRAEDIDVDTGRVNIDIDVLQQEKAEEKARIAESPFYVRIYKFWC